MDELIQFGEVVEMSGFRSHVVHAQNGLAAQLLLDTETPPLDVRNGGVGLNSVNMCQHIIDIRRIQPTGRKTILEQKPTRGSWNGPASMPSFGPAVEG